MNTILLLAACACAVFTVVHTQSMAFPTAPAPEAENPDPCTCTEKGVSGFVSVGNKTGCSPDVTNPGSFYCYVVNPGSCPIVQPSVVFPGAGYRACEPSIEANSTIFMSVLDILANVPEISMLNKIILDLQVGSQLQASRDGVTLFAPTNAAIQELLNILGYTPQQLIDSGEIPSLLLYHIVPGLLPPWLLASATSPAMYATASPAAYNGITVGETAVLNILGNGNVTVQPELAVAEPVFEISAPLYMGKPTGFGALILETFEADDGVVHVIDHVLQYPPNLLQLISQEPDLQTFYNALNQTGIAAYLLDPTCPAPSKVDCNPNPVTIFAPTNAAFENLASDLGISLDDLLNLSSLTEILLYHISDPSILLVPLAASDGDLDNSLIPVLYDNSALTSISQQQLIPLAPSPASESAGNIIDAILSAALGATSGPDSTIKIIEQYITLSGDQNSALVLTDLTLKGYNGAVNGIDTVLLPSQVFSIMSPPQAEATAPAIEGAAAPTIEATAPVNL